MELRNLANELASNAYPGRGIVIGKSADGKNAVTAYFIMGRSVNSRNRVFVAKDGDTIEERTVKTGTDDGSYIEILGGLTEGETVVTSGTEGLRSGTRATVKIQGGGAK